MAPTLARTHLKTSPGSPSPDSFSSARLVRLLAALTTDEVAVSKQSLAERLGLWLDWADAISLSAALAGPLAAEPGTQPPSQAAGIARRFGRVRAELAESILAERMFTARPETARLASSGPGESGEASAPAEEAEHDFAPYRRCYAAYQRAMEAAIAPLRGQVRTSLQRASPELSRLAALDAVLDAALAARERSLLAGVPGLLEKHFKRLRATRPEALAGMGREIQAVLLAELELRLLPVEGLIDALETPNTTSA